MTLLVTGGIGFVMSNLVHRWLVDDDDARAIIVDAQAPDDLANRFFSSVASRLEVFEGDILSTDLWSSLAGRDDIRYIVHGATVTSIGRQVHALVAVNPDWRERSAASTSTSPEP